METKLAKGLIGSTHVIVGRYYGVLINPAQIVMFKSDLEPPAYDPKVSY